MKIKKILVSQPQPDSEKSPYYELAEKNNVKIDFRPFSHVLGVPCKDFRKQRIDILAHTAVVFSSKTAIDHFFRICGEMRVSVPDTMKYFCVSESVAFYLQKYIIYRKRKIFHGNGMVSDMMELIMKHQDERYLLPLSDQQNEELTILLDKQKVKYSKAILYQNVCLDISDLSIINYDLLVFFSPSSFKSLLKNFPEFQQNEIKIGSFGSSTAKASMIAALEQYIKEQNKNCRK
jgi:uroporphyrinogen-III synthase